MKITKIIGSGIKAQQFEHQIGPATLFTGANFAGKSSRLSAVRLALYGVIPDPNAKQTEREMFCAMASGSRMRCAVQFDSGLDIERKWTRDEKGSVTTTVSDGCPAFPEMMLDPRKYLGLSDAKRTEYVFSLLDIGDSAQAAEAAVRKALEDVDADTKEEQAAKAVMIAKVPPFVGKVNAWLDRIGTIIKEDKSAATAVKDRMTGLIQSLTQLEQQATDAKPPRSAAEVARDQEQVQGRIEKGIKVKSDCEAAIQAASTAIRTVDNAKRELDRDVATASAEIKELEDKIAKLRRMRKCPTCGHTGTQWKDELIADHTGTIAKLMETRKQAQVWIEEYTKEREVHATKSATEQANLTKYAHVLDTLNAQRSALIQESQAAGGKAQDQTRKLQAQGERAKAEAELSVLKRAEKSVRELKEKIVEGAFTHLLARANALAQGILLSPLCFRDNVIGRLKGEQFISHGSLSWTTAEQAIGYAAIGMALSEASPFKLLMLDDLSLIDEPNCRKLMGRISELIQRGVIDQFIGADVRNLKHNGIEIVEL